VYEDSAAFTKAVGRRTAELRRLALWTQQELADRMAIDVSAMQRIERGAHACTLHTLWRLAAALSVEPFQLLTPPTIGKARPGRPRKTTTNRKLSSSKGSREEPHAKT
jgi:transcriptional regulator with XRE-family HTH domain